MSKPISIRINNHGGFVITLDAEHLAALYADVVFANRMRFPGSPERGEIYRAFKEFVAEVTSRYAPHKTETISVIDPPSAPSKTETVSVIKPHA